MSKSDRNQERKDQAEMRSNWHLGGANRHIFRLMTVLCLLLGLCLLLAGSAAASYESVGAFGEQRPLSVREPSGIAVNYTGAGGVPIGTVYVVDKSQQFGLVESGAVVMSYTALGSFRQAWGWGVANEKHEFERCGPVGEVAHPTCSEKLAYAGEGAGQIDSPEGVAVDQTTGYVYVFNRNREKGAVQVFTASGEPVGGFGENDLASGEQPISASPEKFHEIIAHSHSRIAVDDTGNVYIADYSNRDSGSEGRVMVFRPKNPGDYEHYEYTGQAGDIGFSSNPIYTNGLVVTDDAGDVYVANDEFVSEFSPGETVSPACRYKLPGAQLAGMTVNPKTGEVFVISFSDFKFRQLAPCNAQGQFVEKTSFSPGPTYVGDYALALDPALAYDSSRPAGIFYFGATPELGRWNIRVYAPAEVRPPRVEAESASSVGATSVVLHAQIDPEGSQTHYSFQYLSKAAYEANGPTDRFAGAFEAPVGGTVLGSGQKALSASASVAGLQPNTAYRFRVLASSPCNPEEEGTPCPAGGVAEQFHTYSLEASMLPDHRVYELVSPPDKAGGQVFQLEAEVGCHECNQYENDPFPKQASANGEAVVFEGTTFATSGGGHKENEYISRRTSSGWQTVDLTPERLETGPYETGFRAFDASLEQGVLASVTPSLAPDAPSEYANLYRFSNGDPTTLSPLLLQEPPNRSPGFGENSLEIIYAGASADLSHVLFEANAAYTSATSFAPEAVDGGPKADNLYEGVGGTLRLVNVLPGNEETVPGATFGAGDLYHPGSGATDSRHSEYDFDHAISEDGSRIFWSDAAGQVYVRENGEVTREIPDHAGKYLTAAADGSKALLSDGLVYDLETNSNTDLTEGQGGFEGVVGQSDDLSTIYFVDKAVIGSDVANEHGETARQGAFNLYVHRESGTAYVGTLEANDNQLDVEFKKAGDWNEAAGYRSAEASPSGRYLAFMSRAQLTGGDSESAACQAGLNPSRDCEEVFLYDSQTGRLVCTSCNPTERPPLGNSVLPINRPEGAFFRLPQHYVTDSGRVYFDSKDSLSPFDTNEGYADVYQYEPEGVGNCERAGGCVKLISAGSEPNDSTFLDTDESGANVFFTTRDRLVQKDRDDLVDLYDARENGGFASETEGSSGECRGEACQPTPTFPGGVMPASLSFEGPGDLAPLLPATPAKPLAKRLTDAEKLLAALKACSRKSPRGRRLACENTAHKHYGPKRKEKAKHTTKKRGR